MSKRFSLLLCGLMGGLALTLSGCHNSDNDDSSSFDTIGEQHVYDLPKPKKLVPIQEQATRVIPQPPPQVATKSYDHIGEENVFDN